MQTILSEEVEHLIEQLSHGLLQDVDLARMQLRNLAVEAQKQVYKELNNIE